MNELEVVVLMVWESVFWWGYGELFSVDVVVVNVVVFYDLIYESEVVCR